MRVLLLCLLLSISFTGLAQTNVGGIINTNTTWSPSGNPYIVNSNITINENVTLTIEAGTLLKFNKGFPRYDIKVEGVLRIVGTEDNLVRFTSNEFITNKGDYGGIFFYDSAEDYDFSNQTGCIIQHAVFEYQGGNDIGGDHTFISMNMSTVFIDRCTFNESDYGVIYTTAQNTELRITNNKFLSIRNSPVIDLAHGISSGDISCNLFYDCDGSIAWLHSGNCNFYNNLIVGNDEASIDVDTLDQFSHNTLIDNYDVRTVIANRGIVEYNTIGRNVFEGPSIAAGGAIIYFVNPEGSATHNNIFDISIKNPGDDFLLQNYLLREAFNSPAIDATNNWFDMYFVSDLSSLVSDYYDDTLFYPINFQPFLLSPEINAPITPPTGVNKVDLGGGNIQVFWNPNPDVDVAGYKIYWGDFTGYSFSNSINVGNVTSYILTGVSFTDTIAVTAYDSDADDSHDQCDGNESWFTYDYMFTGVAEITDLEQNFSCYPNPADAYTVVDLSNLKQATSTVLRTTSGLREHVKTVELKHEQYPVILVSDVSSGFYMVNIYSEDEIAGRAKLVIAR